MGPIIRIFQKKKASMEDRLKRIKDGDEEERENFIKEYTPFIIKCITKVTNKYIEIENNEEFSLGLEAFNEAIDKYEYKRGSFVKYTETIIRNRIIDYHRKMKKQNNSVSIERDNLKEIHIKGTIQNNDFTEKYDMKEQILELQCLLKKYNISFKELVDESPKHSDTRLNAINIARAIVENKDLKDELYRKNTLPAKKIIEKIGVGKKVLKRNRKFIIATVITLDSNLDLLIDYISSVEGREIHGI